MSSPFVLTDRLPTPAEHRRLAEAVGWSHAFDVSTVPASLAGSVAGAVASAGGQVVGMGRLVGDGVKYFYVQDVAVLPAHQGTGIGKALVRHLLDHVARVAPATAFVGLFATDEALPLYEREGFTRGDMTGMFRLVEPLGG
ncbi:GNAT family N-acetyltransferase [Streptomyces sp. NPDC051840]|uniref:GNAT family N-acetyltransferase n=1 Tax=unclassified Streptomyces TaxID=2593676 RepID=UPI003425092B